MGLRPSRGKPWINTDEEWLVEHKARRTILDEPKNSVIRCLPGSELACEEVMMLVVEDLVAQQPKIFRRYNDSDVDRIEILETGETFIIASPFGRLRPLEIAARLAMEDFNILKVGDDGQHRLYVLIPRIKDCPESAVRNLTLYRIATASCCPAGWSIDERIGWSLAWIHGPVPFWHEKLYHSVER